MTMFIIQSAILLAIAFILGCILGCLLRWFFGRGRGAGTHSSQPAPVFAPVPLAAEAPLPAAALMSGSKTTSLAEEVPAEAPVVAKKKPAKQQAAGKKQGGAPARDDIKLIIGIGKTNERALNAMGIFTFAEIAAWSAAEQRRIGEQLAFPGRIEREQWVKQATSLAKGEAPDRKLYRKTGRRG